MSQQYDNTNRGVMFAGDKKTDRHPDWSGSLNVEGKEYFLDAWVKTSQNGREFFSVSVKPKTQQAQPRQEPAPRAPARPAPNRPAPKSATGFDQMDDDVPW